MLFRSNAWKRVANFEAEHGTRTEIWASVGSLPISEVMVRLADPGNVDRFTSVAVMVSVLDRAIPEAYEQGNRGQRDQPLNDRNRSDLNDRSDVNDRNRSDLGRDRPYDTVNYATVPLKAGDPGVPDRAPTAVPYHEQAVRPVVVGGPALPDSRPGPSLTTTGTPTVPLSVRQMQVLAAAGIPAASTTSVLTSDQQAALVAAAVPATLA